jgi:hypothetical protein
VGSAARRGPLRFFRARPGLCSEVGFALGLAGLGMVFAHVGMLPLSRGTTAPGEVAIVVILFLLVALVFFGLAVYVASSAWAKLRVIGEPMIEVVGRDLFWFLDTQRYRIDLRHVERVEAVDLGSREWPRPALRLTVRPQWVRRYELAREGRVDLDVGHGRQDAATLRDVVENARAGKRRTWTTELPNAVPGRRRAMNALGSVALLAYAAYAVYADDFLMPGRRTDLHFHGVSAWLAAAGCLMIALDLVSQVVDHYDRRANESTYERFSCSARVLAWSLFIAGYALRIFVRP